MRTASTWHGLRAHAAVVLLAVVTALALQGCMNVQVRVDPARTAPRESVSYYGVLEDADRSRNYADELASETWSDCWAS
jgi:hypothetical protein